MPEISVFLPRFLKVDLSQMAAYYEISEDTFIALSIAEKLGELKGNLIEEAFARFNSHEKRIVFNWYPVTELAIKDNYVLSLSFEDGLKGECDLSVLIEKSKIYSALADKKIFSTAHIGEKGNSVQWDGGMEIEADILYGRTFLSDY